MGEGISRRNFLRAGTAAGIGVLGGSFRRIGRNQAKAGALQAHGLIG